MIRYHGGPITPKKVAIPAWKRRHAMVSYAYPAQLAIAAEQAHSFALDNGAFTFWTAGKQVNWRRYQDWVMKWRKHPHFDWALIPDVIDGDEKANDELLREWPFSPYVSVPVWHMHEDISRLERLIGVYPRVAQSRLHVVPCTRDEANAFIEQHHRHHGRITGCRFAVAVADDAGEVRGIATVGRPVARALDDGWTMEVTRVATDGCQNACSALYRAAARVALAMGYRRIVTYTLATESGTSLRAAGFRTIARVDGRSWNCPVRPRVDKHPTQDKLRWEADLL